VGFGDRFTERGTVGDEFGRAIVTNGVFTAYVCDSAATRPSFQIILGKLVTDSGKSVWLMHLLQDNTSRHSACNAM